jgi:hypothetical protein
VVIALIAESRRRSTLREIDAFGTPTIVHFCAVLLVSAILSAPWRALSNVSLALGACGTAGVVYLVAVMKRARRLTGYRAVLEDWLWHAVFPLVSYAVLLGAAVVLPRHPAPALFVIGATALLLLFIGIHNTWDTVTYVAIERWQAPKDGGDLDVGRRFSDVSRRSMCDRTALAAPFSPFRAAPAWSGEGSGRRG